MALDQAGYRLPPEAEWEYACRAGTTTAYHTGDTPENLEEAEWSAWNSDGQLHEAAQKTPNPWGLFDISGNAMEWVWGVYEEYPTESVTDPSGPDPETQVLRRLRRVVRGGNFSPRLKGNRIVAETSDGAWILRSISRCRPPGLSMPKDLRVVVCGHIQETSEFAV